jgi:hypothetical protein
MELECFGNPRHPIKSEEYSWSNSGSAVPADNTLLNRPTFWIYQNVLKYFNKDPKKGANGDQLRAYFIPMYQNNEVDIAKQIFFGMIQRGGMVPSWMEFAPLKPQCFVLLFKLLCEKWSKVFYLPYKFCLYCFEKSIKSNLAEPISESTTNKISLLPTMKVLGMKLPDDEYIKSVYYTYFPQPELRFLADKIIDYLTKKENV